MSSTPPTASLGTPCDPAGDKFGCDGLNFFSCDQNSRRWVFQNTCGGSSCFTDPTFGSFCYQNIPENRPKVPSSTSSTSSAASSSPTSTAVTGSNNSSTGSIGSNITADNASQGSGGLSKSGAIGLGVGISLFVLLLAASIVIYTRYFRRSSPADPAPTRFDSSGLAGIPSAAGSEKRLSFLDMTMKKRRPESIADMAHILDQKYIAHMDYEPAASDELKLRVGDTLVLDLLFNDGWSKGKNETTGQEGILPVACIKPIDA